MSETGDADWADEVAFRMLQDMPSDQWTDVPILVRNARVVIAAALRKERAETVERAYVAALGAMRHGTMNADVLAAIRALTPRGE